MMILSTMHRWLIPSLTKVLLTQQKGDGSVARMSNADRLRPGLGLPMSDRLVVTGPVERRAPTTSPHTSLAHPGKWFRRHTSLYTQQGAAFNTFEFTSQEKLLRHPLHSHIVYYTRYYGTPSSQIAYKTIPPTAAAHRRAPLRASKRLHPPHAKNKPIPHRTWSCAANTRRPLQPYTLLTHNLLKPNIVYYPSTTMSLPSNLPESYKHVLLRDQPAPQFADDHLSPRSRLVGHPLAPFLTVPQLPTADHGMGSPLEPAPGVSLQAPLGLTAPPPSPNLGRAVDLSARTIDSYLLTCQYSTAPFDHANFWLHGVFLVDTPHSSHMLLPASSIARCLLLEEVNALTDRPARVRNIIGRDLTHRTRWTASITRTQHLAKPPNHDHTPCLLSTLEWLPGSTNGHSLCSRYAILASFTPA
jgi:hypothetical protein